MNWIDGAVIGLVVLSGIWGLARGLVREVLSLAAWLSASVGCVTLLPWLRPYAQDLVRDPYWVDPVAYLAGFLLVLVPLGVLAAAVGGATQRSVLGSVNRGLGLVFGLARGAMLVVVAYVAVAVALPPADLPPPVREARLWPRVGEAAAWTVQRMPPDYQARLVPAARPDDASPYGRGMADEAYPSPYVPGQAFPHPLPATPLPARAVQP